MKVAVGADTDIGTEELVQLTSRFRDALLDLDLDEVYSARGGAVPDSSKGVNLAAAGGLVVQFALPQDLLRLIVDTVRFWLGRQHSRAVKLTLDGDSLELTGISSATQHRLVELRVMRHDGAG